MIMMEQVAFARLVSVLAILTSVAWFTTSLDRGLPDMRGRRGHYQCLSTKDRDMSHAAVSQAATNLIAGVCMRRRVFVSGRLNGCATNTPSIHCTLVSV